MQVRYYILAAVILAVYAVGMCVDVMAVDAAQYAEISLEMLRTKSFLQVHALGRDYLDKPPLLFWLNSISFYLLGPGTFSCKLPSVLFALLGIYATYRFALLYYSRRTALMAALMLATTQALFLITNDVRTDTLLMGTVIFAIWRLAAWTEAGRLRDLLCGCVGVGLALLSKGPIGLIAVGAALLPHILIRGKWRSLLRVELIAGIALIALLLVPMCIGLYEQYGVKGLRFYFWTQSFGRITGESEWNNHPDTFFLLHSTAWAFMPWTLFLLGGWLTALIAVVRNSNMPEYISVSGFTLVLIALMLSHYQLPHYSFIVYPLGAVMAADFYERLDRRSVFYKSLVVVQILILIAIAAVAGLLQYCFKGTDTVSLVSLVGVFGAAAGAVVWLRGGNMIIRASAATILAFNLLMSAFYFPAILRYQPGSDFGRYARLHTDGRESEFVTYRYLAGYEDVFYSCQPPPQDLWDSAALRAKLQQRKYLVVATSENGLQDLRQSGVRLKILDTRQAYKVSSLTWTFLNPATRNGVCERVYLVEVISGSQ